jgi:alkylated DNA nucleotide flippase Atl1
MKAQEILDFLNRNQVRATYGAVADLLGVLPRGVGAILGEKRPEASWVVNAQSGEPTGYTELQRHPGLHSKPPILRTGDELRRALRRGHV